LAGTIIIENVFYLPGLGRLVFQAITQRDLIVVESVVMLLVAAVIAVNLPRRPGLCGGRSAPEKPAMTCTSTSQRRRSAASWPRHSGTPPSSAGFVITLLILAMARLLCLDALRRHDW
jgi:hypothetical protein